jgi:hypothetical protein
VENVQKGPGEPMRNEPTASSAATAPTHIDYCKSILQFNDSKITGIDTKASFLTGISSVMLALTASAMVTNYQTMPSYIYMIGIGTVISLLVALTFAIRVVIPATENQVTYKEPPNDFFCNRILDASREDYRKKIQDSTQGTMVENYLNEIYTLAEILSQKYRRVRHASYALLAAIAFIFIQLMCIMVPKVGLW